MRSFKSIITGIFPFVIFPYCLVILFVVCYYALMKYRIWRDIRNVCYPPTIKIDRNKFKLNLQIESMVYSFTEIHHIHNPAVSCEDLTILFHADLVHFTVAILPYGRG